MRDLLMPRPTTFHLVIPLILVLGLLTSMHASASEFSFFHENVMGTSLELRVVADSARSAEKAEARVLAEIDRLSAIFSSHNPQSEFSSWQRTREIPVRVSSELFDVLSLADRLRIATAGAFDPRVAVVSQVWSNLAKEGRTPDDVEIARARDRMSGLAWRLDATARTAEHLTDCPLTLDAIAKGYIVGRACEVGLEQGAVGLLLNVGGDLRVVGAMAPKVGIVDPSRDSESTAPLTTIQIRDRSVSTSGNSQRGVRINGRWYSHILDPRTGRPVETTTSATVVSRQPAETDALATAFNVLSPEESFRLAASLPDVDCLIVDAQGRTRQSANWRRIDLALADRPEIETPNADAWGHDFELIVRFEINRPEAEAKRYRRPYVAIWVEDAEGKTVRNLALWVSMGGSGPFQWLPDLKRWYKNDQIRKRTDKTEMVITIARPTRPPGKYSVLWDGKDDHGKPLPRGEYTLCIDAAREHGTYQSMKTPVTIAEAPFSINLPGGVEIKAATVDFARKKTAK